MRLSRLRAIRFAVFAGCAALLPVGPIRAEQGAQVDNDGTIHVPAFALPESSLLKRARAAKLPSAAPLETCPRIQEASASEAPAIRKCERRVFQASSDYRRLR